VSYEVWGEPDDGLELPEDWWDGDSVQQLRDLLRYVDMPDPPRAGSKSDAALILLDHLLTPPRATEKYEDPHVLWAKTLMKDLY
jgi:hypothetical protein